MSVREQTHVENSVVKFLVNGIPHQVPTRELTDFPLKTALLNLLHEKLLNMSIGVKVIDGAIIIEHPCQHFDKLLQLYANPQITLHKLLDLDFIAAIDAENQIFRETIVAGNWTDQNLIEERFLANQLLQEKGYQMLIPENFKQFKREMQFFGVWTLLEPPLKRQIDAGLLSIDPAQIIERIKSSLPGMYPVENRVEPIVESMKSIGGYMSGSFVLKHVLNEDWDCNDIDIYVNETNLKGMLVNNHFGGIDGNIIPKEYPILKDFFRILEARAADRNRDPDITRPKPIIETKYVSALACLVAKLFDGTIDRIHTQSGRLFDSRSKELNGDRIEPSLDIKISDDAYMSQHHAIADSIAAVIKLDVQGLKIDLVVVDVTVPYFIDKYFDFAFNKVFYDGYNITALDWKAVLNKRCKNKVLKQIGTRDVDYLTNIARIHKYTQRGFIVQTRN